MPSKIIIYIVPFMHLYIKILLYAMQGRQQMNRKQKPIQTPSKITKKD
jgi:hypothetical protein